LPQLLLDLLPEPSYRHGDKAAFSIRGMLKSHWRSPGLINTISFADSILTTP
jgi:hypothetical protein